MGTLESYNYLGLGTVVIRSHPQPTIDLTYVKQSGESTGDAGDQYTGLDRFGLVVDQRWINTSTSTATDRFQYGYDRDSNVLYRDNLVNTAFGEVYTYDGLNQLASFDRGTLNGTKTGITGTVARSQDWDYDALGNFDSVTTDGTAQTRSANKQNEITSISGATTPAYDSNGNMTGDETGKTFVYDAWNRLVVVKNGATTLETFSYDGLNRRVTNTVSGTTTDLFYSSAWQVLEEQVSGSTTNRYVWSPVYVDAMVLRDRDTDANGSLDERLWPQHDVNYNVTSLIDGSGVVQERLDEDPFGKVTVLDANWSADADGVSDFGWLYSHQGGRYDPVSGLFYYRWRDYSPTLGRWAQSDMILFASQDNNFYAYVGNNPSTFTDPSGLDKNGPIFPKQRKVNTNSGTVVEGYPFSDQDKFKKKNDALGGPTQYYVVILITDNTIDLDYKGWRSDEPYARIYQDVENLDHAISILNRYEDAPIGRLIISGHNNATGCGVSVFPSKWPHIVNKDDATPISYKTVTGDKAKAISKKLTPDAVVVIASCNAGADPKKMQILADNLRHPIQASDSECGLGYGTSGTYRQVNPGGGQLGK